MVFSYVPQAGAHGQPVSAADILDAHDPKKHSVLMSMCPLFAMLFVVWAFYYMRKDMFADKSVAYIALAGFSFSVTSVSMHTLNKACVSFTGAPSSVTIVQMIIAVVAILAVQGREVLAANRNQMMRWCIVPIVYAAMLNSSLFGFQYVSLTMLTIFRNLAPMVTMAVEGIIMPPEHRPQVTTSIIFSLMIMVVGAVLFSYGDESFSWVGVSIVLLNTIVAIFDRVLQRRLLVKECKDLPLSACMTINNTLGVLPSVALIFLTGESQGLNAAAANWADPGVITLIIMSGFMGLGIGFFGLMCQKAMSATSFQVLQNMSKVVVVSIGVGIFGDKVVGIRQSLGIILSLVGSAAYGAARTQENNNTKAEMQKLTEKKTGDQKEV